MDRSLDSETQMNTFGRLRMNDRVSSGLYAQRKSYKPDTKI